MQRKSRACSPPLLCFLLNVASSSDASVEEVMQAAGVDYKEEVA